MNRDDTNKVADPTGDYAIERERYKKNIEMLRRTCRDVDESLSDYILKGVAFGIPYSTLRTRYGIPFVFAIISVPNMEGESIALSNKELFW